MIMYRLSASCKASLAYAATFVAAWLAVPTSQGQAPPGVARRDVLSTKVVRRSVRISGEPVLGEGPLSTATIARLGAERLKHEFETRRIRLAKGVKIDQENAETR